MTTSYPINFLLNNALTLCEVKWGLLGWLKYMGCTVLGYQPENVGKHADVFRLCEVL